MRFKIFYNEIKGILDVNCLQDDSGEIVLPENLNQHVFFPIPSDLLNEIHSEIMSILDQNISNEYKKIDEEIKELQKKRSNLIMNVRKQLNPLIIKKCEEFRNNNPEHFI